MFCFVSSQGLRELEELQQRYDRLEQLYNEAVSARDEAIEERDKATVLIALQLQSETEELTKKIETLQTQNKKLSEENEDLKIRLSYAKDDLNKLQQRHIRLQIEQENCLQEKEDALVLLKELEGRREISKGGSIKEEKELDGKKMTNVQTVCERNHLISTLLLRTERHAHAKMRFNQSRVKPLVTFGFFVPYRTDKFSFSFSYDSPCSLVLEVIILYTYVVSKQQLE